MATDHLEERSFHRARWIPVVIIFAAVGLVLYDGPDPDRTSDEADEVEPRAVQSPDAREADALVEEWRRSLRGRNPPGAPSSLEVLHELAPAAHRPGVLRALEGTVLDGQRDLTVPPPESGQEPIGDLRMALAGALYLLDRPRTEGMLLELSEPRWPAETRENALAMLGQCLTPATAGGRSPRWQPVRPTCRRTSSWCSSVTMRSRPRLRLGAARVLAGRAKGVRCREGAPRRQLRAGAGGARRVDRRHGS